MGSGFSFSGGIGYLRVPASRELNVGTNDGMTVEAWVNPSNVTDQSPIVEWAWVGYYGVHLYIGTDGPGCLFANLAVDNGGDSSLVSAPGVVVAGQFQHLALTYDRLSGVARLFRNAIVVREKNLGSFIPQTKSDMYLAYRPASTPGGPLSLSGIIDEPAIYNRALSPAEIQAVYEAGAAGKCKLPTISRQPQSQLGFWGKNVTFTVVAYGEPPLRFQWWEKGAPMSDATNSSVTLTNLQLGGAGVYQVFITNVYGSITSNPAILTVNPAGVSIALYSGVTIDGVEGFTYGIQSTTDLSDTNSWQGTTNITLTSATQLWLDTQPASQAHRYYRVVPGPISIP